MTGTPERIGRYTVAKELGSGGMGMGMCTAPARGEWDPVKQEVPKP
ncbi:MAG: hypothetical protein JO362_16820 [Streptomycetaceae bacterium]|nr:hypothetical protein [Streptomycetaceae bacterium]